MAYDYDVFVSYNRSGDWPHWVRNFFKHLLEHWLTTDLGRPAKVFVDDQIENGALWPARLANALGSSRVLVPLFSRAYPSSAWCCAELEHMFQREELCSLRNHEHPEGLIEPALIHDGEHLPTAIRQRIQINVELQKFTAVSRKDSPRYEELSEAIRTWSPSIAQAIDRAPPHDATWSTLAARQFQEIVVAPRPAQVVVPSLGAV